MLRFAEISKPPTNKDLAFVTVPFLLRYNGIYDTSAILSHAVRSENTVTNLRSHNFNTGKKKSKYQSEENFSQSQVM